MRRELNTLIRAGPPPGRVTRPVVLLCQGGVQVTFSIIRVMSPELTVVMLIAQFDTGLGVSFGFNLSLFNRYFSPSYQTPFS